ncbi:3-methyl-2-oxobutanoate hydroxymethyltransferase [Hyphomonas sp.]|uniref:3-methyl-2-oxobutanoate hydroxymethyltransferase n=1 Tax=Hyphomonas sp. TaxID=87 RepID=UPI000C89E6F0|nr:3-methyl-2-oxobutanoate hydroxymethyltransferase [Hyphomonas sp.]MAL45551.1 3-methyl-2-oxobutanoate hydroxymethyltransferase [Hyphomonas sp.]|tara:strand:- start:325 stop:1245 length:921 start_codon:yes stop_codon:yes gene_type:complete
MPADSKTKKTILTLKNNKKNNQPTVLVTAYDYPQARIADMAGVDCILIGDSLGMTTLGHKTTIPVSMDNMITSCEAVARGAKNALIIGDMPYMSYQPSDQIAVENAGRFIVSGCDMVKVEGAMTDRIKAICDAGIMVMSHLGLTPHTRAKLGGYRVQGKTAEQAEIVLRQALDLQDAGCSALLLEAMPKEPAAMIADKLDIPVYGIGAGDEVDGQLVIFHDLMGLFWEFKSKFVKRYCEAGQIMADALTTYVEEVRNREFPTEENFYEIKDEELEKLLGDAKWKYETDQGFPTNHSATPNTVTKKD